MYLLLLPERFRKASLIGTYLIFLSIFCLAQSAKVKEIYQEGEDFFEAKDYKEALYDFQQVEQKGYKNPNLHYKIGVCYLNISGEESKAVSYLEDAVKHITPKYRAKNIDEKRTPLHSLFYLGNAYRFNNQLDSALNKYRKFINAPEYQGTYNVDIVEKEIKVCERAKIIQDAPINVTWINLGQAINTHLSETNVVISGNEEVLAYLTGLKFYNAVYVAHKVDNVWLAPENINPQIRSDGDFYPTALSFDGKELYLVKINENNCDIYVSNYSDGRWNVPQPLNSNINSSKDETSAAISKDGKTLYFSSNRRGGQGGFDIYRSVRISGNNWGKAENLGKNINTDEDETTPSISSDGKCLYFSSKGQFNMGGFDIFYSVLQLDNQWSIPFNLGFPVNTTTDNVRFQTIGDGKVGYISRIAQDSFGKEDIYKVEIRSRFEPKTVEKK